MGNRSYKLAGDIFMAPVDADGVLTGNYVKQGNLHPLTITVSTSQEDMKSAHRDTPGQILESIATIDTIEAEATLRQWSVDALAYALAATVESLSGTAGSVAAASGSTLTAPAVDGWVYVGHENITNLVLSEDTDTSPATYVAGEHYNVDAQLGMFSIIAGAAGGFATGDAVRYAYDYAAGTGKRINIGKTATNYVAIKGSLKNLNSGDVMSLELYKVQISASGSLTLISDPDTKFEELPQKWKLLTPPGKLTPGTLDGGTL